MKKITIASLSVIFVALIACSIQSISADHMGDPFDLGIFVGESEANLVTTHGSNYQVYLQAVLRNGDDQLIGVVETTKTGAYIPNKITDHVFDTLMGEKEIVTIDNIKYEKVQWMFSPTLEQRWVGMYPIFEEVPIKFKIEGDALAQINEKIKNYSIWKVHYCATFEGHGYSCIPIFQVLIPTIALEPDDVIIQQWTVLRELN